MRFAIIRQVGPSGGTLEDEGRPGRSRLRSCRRSRLQEVTAVGEAKEMPANKTTAKSTKAKKATTKKTTVKRTASSKATAKTSTSKTVTRKQVTTKTPQRGSGRSEAPSGRPSSGQTARPGDIIVIDSAQVGSPAREGEVLKVTVGAFSVRYQVRWGDGHESIISPSGGTARIIRT